MKESAHLLGKPVESLQTMLRLISFSDPRILPLIPDGYYGSNTYASVRSFQEVSGLPVTGAADLQTWQIIADTYARISTETGAPVVLPFWQNGQQIEPGSQNAHLYLVQAMLLALSGIYPTLKAPGISGILDSETQSGIQQIQRAAALPETGSLDTLTWRALSALYRIAIGDGTKNSPL